MLRAALAGSLLCAPQRPHSFLCDGERAGDHEEQCVSVEWMTRRKVVRPHLRALSVSLRLAWTSSFRMLVPFGWHPPAAAVSRPTCSSETIRTTFGAGETSARDAASCTLVFDATEAWLPCDGSIDLKPAGAPFWLPWTTGADDGGATYQFGRPNSSQAPILPTSPHMALPSGRCAVNEAPAGFPLLNFSTSQEEGQPPCSSGEKAQLGRAQPRYTSNGGRRGDAAIDVECGRHRGVIVG